MIYDFSRSHALRVGLVLAGLDDWVVQGDGFQGDLVVIFQVVVAPVGDIHLAVEIGGLARHAAELVFLHEFDVALHFQFLEGGKGLGGDGGGGVIDGDGGAIGNAAAGDDGDGAGAGIELVIH